MRAETIFEKILEDSPELSQAARRDLLELSEQLRLAELSDYELLSAIATHIARQIMSAAREDIEPFDHSTERYLEFYQSLSAVLSGSLAPDRLNSADSRNPKEIRRGIGIIDRGLLAIEVSLREKWPERIHRTIFGMIVLSRLLSAYDQSTVERCIAAIRHALAAPGYRFDAIVSIPVANIGELRTDNVIDFRSRTR